MISLQNHNKFKAFKQIPCLSRIRDGDIKVIGQLSIQGVFYGDLLYYHIQQDRNFIVTLCGSLSLLPSGASAV